MAGKAQKSHGARSKFNSVFGLEEVDRWNPIRISATQSRFLCSVWKKCIGGTALERPPYSLNLAPRDFWTFPTTKRELRGKKFQSDQEVKQTVCNTFSRSGWSAVKKFIACQGRYTSIKFRLGIIRRVHELFKRPSYEE
jgi:hypothetical protein